jgi:hypothetical protein
MEVTKERLQEIKEKRVRLIVRLWSYFIKTGYFDEKEVALSDTIVKEVVEHYCTDYVVLKYRYKIEDRIERSKIAGLMISTILRYRPIHLISDKCESEESLYANEILAIIYGLSVCFEDEFDSCVPIIKKPWFQKWFSDFKYLLHVRHYTSEALAFLFKTLMIFLKDDEESKE